MRVRRLTGIAVAILAIIFGGKDARSQDSISVGDTLSLKRAVQLALQYHPSLRIADAGVRVASASVDRAQKDLYPTLSGLGSFTRGEGLGGSRSSTGARTSSSSGSAIQNNYSAGLQLQQPIYDFGKTYARVRSARDSRSATEADKLGRRGDVILNVQIAYYELAGSQQAERVDSDAVSRAEEHLRQAEAFYEVGSRTKLDVTRAEVDLANANVNLIRARNQTRLAHLALQNAIGIQIGGEYAINDSLSLTEFDLPLPTVMSLADSARPELVAARARLAAARAAVSASQAGHYPALSAFGSYNYSNSDFPLKRQASGGLSLSVPLFQGFDVAAQVEQARAGVESAEATLALLHQSVTMDVEQNFLALQEARERTAAAEKLVAEAEENLNLSERQYAAGVASNIEVIDARLTLSNARLTRIQALADYQTSLARLHRAIGAAE